uniref:Uncharacterized protein n=1 Tax=Sphaerodactylus townsendi TaxID=933632 RepID=A0ACB8FS27_9SAUR
MVEIPSIHSMIKPSVDNLYFNGLGQPRTKSPPNELGAGSRERVSTAQEPGCGCPRRLLERAASPSPSRHVAGLEDASRRGSRRREFRRSWAACPGRDAGLTGRRGCGAVGGSSQPATSAGEQVGSLQRWPPVAKLCKAERRSPLCALAREKAGDGLGCGRQKVNRDGPGRCGKRRPRCEAPCSEEPSPSPRGGRGVVRRGIFPGALAARGFGRKFSRGLGWVRSADGFASPLLRLRLLPPPLRREDRPVAWQDIQSPACAHREKYHLRLWFRRDASQRQPSPRRQVEIR